jgi:propionyl-CoA synthetase
MRSIANAKEYNMPSTIDDPVILEEITETLKSIGYPKV